MDCELANTDGADLTTGGRFMRWAVGYEDLVRSSAMELFHLAQRPIFLKNLVFQTLDFVVREIESGGAWSVPSGKDGRADRRPRTNASPNPRRARQPSPV